MREDATNALALQKTLPTIPIEIVFTQHPKIRRCALVGIGRNQEQAAIVIERWDQKTKLKKYEALQFYQSLHKLAQTTPYSRQVEKFFLHKSFPVDTRHNIKIRREVLQKWCEKNPHRQLFQ